MTECTHLPAARLRHDGQVLIVCDLCLRGLLVVRRSGRQAVKALTADELTVVAKFEAHWAEVWALID